MMKPFVLFFIFQEINCDHPGTLYNGWIENTDSGTGLGASVIFRCLPDMLLHGFASSVCQIDGRWHHPLPECLAPCVIPAISQGKVRPIDPIPDENLTATTYIPTTTTHVTLSLSYTEKVNHGTILEVNCSEHYEFPIVSNSHPTCKNGTWSTIPRCIPARCKDMPKSPKHGMVLAPKTEHGMKATFKCRDGFVLVDPTGKEIPNTYDHALTCSFGNWTGETPQCQEVYCSFPGYIPNGKVLLVGNMGLYDYRPYVRRVCDITLFCLFKEM